MNRLFWLTAIPLLFCCTAFPQQPADTIVHLHTQLNSPNPDLFTTFSSQVRNSKNVTLQWTVKAEDIENGSYFIVERGTDEEHFETIGVLKTSGNSTHYGLTDSSAPNGTGYYRVHYSGTGTVGAYSSIAMVTLSADVDFKFYPNPVDKLLIIRTGHNITIQVSDLTGAVRVTRELQPGLQVLNVSSLERGTYVLRIADKESNRVVTERLLKN